MTTDLYKYRFRRCPNCGNEDRAFLQDNGAKGDDPDFRMLCTAPVTEAVSTIEASLLSPEDEERLAVSGVMECGMQWEPNSILPDDEE